MGKKKKKAPPFRYGADNTLLFTRMVVNKQFGKDSYNSERKPPLLSETRTIRTGRRGVIFETGKKKEGNYRAEQQRLTGSNNLNKARVCMVFHRYRLGNISEMGSPPLYMSMACISSISCHVSSVSKGPNSGSTGRVQRQKRRNSIRSLGNQLVDKLVLFDEKRKKKEKIGCRLSQTAFGGNS
jgi:hypothetical protein